MTDDGSFELAPLNWLSTLPSYQRSLLNTLLATMGHEEAARVWLEGGATSDNAPFGASTGMKVFFEKFLDELHDLLCTGENYEEEKRNALKELGAGKTTAAAYISQQISPHLGASANILAPAVAVILCLVSTIGLRAWCETQSQRRASSRPD